jgi:predicted Zn-dependent protease
MLLTLVNEMLIDYDGISMDTYESLIDYLRSDDKNKQLLETIFKNVKTANERWYITEYMELNNE